MASRNGIDRAVTPLRLRVLLEVERCGSVSAAADACGIGQPSATNHLQTLEVALGQRLVERDGRRSRLTDAGRLVARHAARVLESLEEVREDLDALMGIEDQSLTLAASTTPGAYVLPHILHCFSERHPHVQVKVTIGPSDQVVERVTRREAQLGIAGEATPRPGLTLEPFFDDELVGVAAPGYVDLKDGCLTPKQLAEETLLVREPGSSTRRTAERYLDKVDLNLAGAWELDSNEAIKRAVREGLGVGFLSRLTVEEEITRGELVPFCVRGCGSMKLTICLVRPRDRQPTRPESAFAATLAECCNTKIKGCAVGSTP